MRKNNFKTTSREWSGKTSHSVFITVPKVALLASLISPMGMAFAKDQRSNLLETKNQSSPIYQEKGLTEESQVQLACLLSCGVSCRFTDNC